MMVEAQLFGLILAAAAAGWSLLALLLLARKPRTSLAWGLALCACITGLAPFLPLEAVPFESGRDLLLGDLAAQVAWCGLALWLTVDLVAVATAASRAVAGLRRRSLVAGRGCDRGRFAARPVRPVLRLGCVARGRLSRPGADRKSLAQQHRSWSLARQSSLPRLWRHVRLRSTSVCRRLAVPPGFGGVVHRAPDRAGRHHSVVRDRRGAQPALARRHSRLAQHRGAFDDVVRGRRLSAGLRRAGRSGAQFRSSLGPGAA